jgi:hypothetical protein
LCYFYENYEHPEGETCPKKAGFDEAPSLAKKICIFILLSKSVIKRNIGLRNKFLDVLDYEYNTYLYQKIIKDCTKNK